jgi:hypothetical protein
VKKTLLVIALAALLVLAFAGSAFAAGINHSGQDRLGASAVAPAFGYDLGGNYVSIPGAGTYTYKDWNKALGTNATEGNSPHGNYTTTTVKCVVCHAVHYAAPGGATVASGNQAADTLLRMKASDACIFCHATDGLAVNGRPVYNGLGTAITAPGATGGNTTTGHVIGTNCTYCHTNVHGAGADHSVASLDGYLLKLMTATDVQGTGATTTNMLEAITAIDHNAVNQGFAPGAALNGTIGDYATSTDHALYGEQAVGIFCAECHLGAYATAAAGAATNVYESGTAAFTGHRIAAGATSDWNAAHDVSSGLVSNTTIAWAPADNCKSCHDSVDRYGNPAFPHAWGGTTIANALGGTKMWLTAAADAGAPAEVLPAGGGINAYDAGSPQLYDGVCLKCHVESGGAAGVGISY